MERIHTVLQGSENICQIFFMSLNFPKIKYNVCVIVSCRLDLALTEFITNIVSPDWISVL